MGKSFAFGATLFSFWIGSDTVIWCVCFSFVHTSNRSVRVLSDFSSPLFFFDFLIYIFFLVRIWSIARARRHIIHSLCEFATTQMHSPAERLDPEWCMRKFCFSVGRKWKIIFVIAKLIHRCQMAFEEEEKNWIRKETCTHSINHSCIIVISIEADFLILLSRDNRCGLLQFQCINCLPVFCFQRCRRWCFSP